MIMEAIKIKSYKISKRGLRSFAVSLPAIWIRDMDLQPGDSVDIYRNENDELILKAEKHFPNQENSEIQESEEEG